MSQTLAKAEAGTLAPTRVSSERDTALAAALEELTTGRRESLERIWELCGDRF
jgi:hypothetical protein